MGVLCTWPYRAILSVPVLPGDLRPAVLDTCASSHLHHDSRRNEQTPTVTDSLGVPRSATSRRTCLPSAVQCTDAIICDQMCRNCQANAGTPGTTVWMSWKVERCILGLRRTSPFVRLGPNKDPPTVQGGRSTLIIFLYIVEPLCAKLLQCWHAADHHTREPPDFTGACPKAWCSRTIRRCSRLQRTPQLFTPYHQSSLTLQHRILKLPCVSSWPPTTPANSRKRPTAMPPTGGCAVTAMCNAAGLNGL